ncbi:MAG: arginase family protein [Chloroflexi bacterium]|nr:arginase family protein [Chloroflexota bacterium]
MATPHIQIVTASYDSGHRDWRMGKGPAHVLEHGLKDTLVQNGHSISSTDIQVDVTGEIAIAFGVCRALAEQVKAARESRALPILLTGNCGNALGTVSALGTEKTGIIWFDAHGEFNTPTTTRSGFLDGMGLATMTGRGWQALASTVPGFAPVPDDHIILIGVRDLDPDERSLLESSGVICLSVEQIRHAGMQNALAPHLERLRQKVEQVYVHFDLDVLDPAEAKANQWTPPDGLTVAEVKQAVETVKTQFRVAAGGLASFDPDTDTDHRALNAALELFGTLVQV